MSEEKMDTETALAVANKRIADTDLKGSYFITRQAFENVLPTDNEYTVALLEDLTEKLRTVLVDYLSQDESELELGYAEWLDDQSTD